MSQEKMNNLVKYSNELKNKLSNTVLPEKHKNHPVQYKLFLERELKTVNTKIDNLKMNDTGKK